MINWTKVSLFIVYKIKFKFMINLNTKVRYMMVYFSVNVALRRSNHEMAGHLNTRKVSCK